MKAEQPQNTIEYKGFKIKILPVDPYEDTFVWEIWYNTGRGGDECIDESNSIEGFDMDTAICEAKKNIDNEEWFNFWSEQLKKDI